MQVYKFGGASIATAERMQALWPIVESAEQPIVIVASALGKTTNALENVVAAACKGDKKQAQDIVAGLEQQHIGYAKTLLDEKHFAEAEKGLNVFFTELQWAIDDASADRYDYCYDQIVCIGELMSTRIFACFLQQQGFNAEWQDIRDIIRTDDTYRDARVDEEYTEAQVKQKLMPMLGSGKSIVTQGFIGATSDNASTTLGREGSDYTAALLGAMIQANGVTIWKDVEGLKNADPKKFPNTVRIEAISYHEVIEMAYYGAQVVHPKTIKPLQNNKIPLYIKCFLNKDLKGTVVMEDVSSLFYPPLIVQKSNQVLLKLTAKDFSFITESKLRDLYDVFHRLNIKVNLIQNAAISFLACIDQHEGKLKALVAELSKDYSVFDNEDVSLLTIRHYTPEVLNDLTKGRHIILEQKTKHTVQVVLM
ncbi:MAG: aspartate kinase [Chitinophagales bacterium]|nr:aspartate kinase [Chitinophagaceae bacterium]MCB9065141.1 aspartate kinase [Chitinophagales bacterium]